MEFTDGLNQIFAGAMYRWQHDRWTPHVGFGVGASVPHVEVRRAGSEARTFDYQLTGIAVEGLIGVEYHLTRRLAAFGDYKLSFSNNDTDLKGGGTLETDIWTNHLSWACVKFVRRRRDRETQVEDEVATTSRAL
jgi:lipid A oxidase